MKKIVIQPIKIAPMAKSEYKVNADRFKSFDYPVYYSMSGIIPQFLAPAEELKLITVVSSSETPSVQKTIAENVKRCHDEFELDCEQTGSPFNAVDINIPYDVNNKYFEKMFSQIIGEIEEGSEIFVDCTFGDRFITLFLYSVVQFAEQCLGCKLNIMTCAKQDYDDSGKPVDGSQVITDITSVYYLYKIISTLHSTDGKKAIKTVQDFLAL